VADELKLRIAVEPACKYELRSCNLIRSTGLFSSIRLSVGKERIEESHSALREQVFL
jgi:hypothetical protein